MRLKNEEIIEARTANRVDGLANHKIDEVRLSTEQSEFTSTAENKQREYTTVS